MTALRARRPAVALLCCLAALLSPAGLASAGDGYSYATPWFRTARIEPIFEIPDVIAFGPLSRAEVLRDGAWREVFRGKWTHPSVLDGGRAVVLRASGEVYRADTPEVIRFPAGPCGEFAYGRLTVPHGLERVACVHATSARGCGRLEVSQYDLAGRLLRRDGLGPDTVCTMVKGDGDPASHALGGLTAGGDPVVAVQVDVDAEGRPRHAVFVLESGGARELGRFTAQVRLVYPWAYTWPKALSAAVAHAST